MINWNNIKFRASSWGNLLAESKEKGNPIGKTCAGELIKIYNQEVYGRKKDITTKQMDKGIICEPEAIQLYSLLEGRMYYKNDEQLENEWFRGHPDIGDTDDIRQSYDVSDIKCSWDLDSFMSKLLDEPISTTTNNQSGNGKPAIPHGKEHREDRFLGRLRKSSQRIKKFNGFR
jgi:hypothetical protein